MPQYLDKAGLEYYTQEIKKKFPSKISQLDNDTGLIRLQDIPVAGFNDILDNMSGRVKVSWDQLEPGEFGSNSTYNGNTIVPVFTESASFWNSGSGYPMDIAFHFSKKEVLATLLIKCVPYGGTTPEISLYYAQKGDAELTAYGQLSSVTTNERFSLEFNEENIAADIWVVRITCSGWIDLRLCQPSSSFQPGLYGIDFHNQILEKFNAKQDRLVAGENITIKNNVISSTGGSSGAQIDEILLIEDENSKATINPIYRSGYIAVDNIVIRNTIDKDKLEVGSRCYVKNEDKFYKLTISTGSSKVWEDDTQTQTFDRYASAEKYGTVIIGSNLTTDNDGKLMVDVATEEEQGSNRPISAGAVYNILGDIKARLKNI